MTAETGLHCAHGPDGVATFTLDRPGVKNALTVATYQELRDSFLAAAHDEAIRAIVLHGAHGDFCSGGHVEEIIGPLTRASEHERHEFCRLTGDVVLAMRALGKPIIAAVDGIAAGGGAALALAADLRVGTPRTRFAFLFARVGLSAADMGVSWLLPRVVGLGRATELVMLGDAIDAQTALAWGLLNRVAPEGDGVAEATAWARRLAEGPAPALAASKTIMEAVAAMELPEALAAEIDAQTACMQNEDFREGYRAFVEKRAPRFRG